MSPRDPDLPEGAVAIVGMAGRFPGAADVRALWANLLAEIEGVRRLEDEELARAGVPEELRRDPAWVAVAADLEDLERFDAAFFGMAPREARVVDPQQKLLLELAWEACEEAGLVPRRFPGACGVFVGASRSDWGARVAADPAHLAALGAFGLELATGRDFLATRIAWLLGCEGPCLTVQTACSTSLVAVHLACQSLLAGESDVALAGGASVRLPQATGYRWVEGGVASRDGRCRAFDARASGTVPGNGAALVCLRRLEDALADGDPIVAVVRGSAVNNDGTHKAGFTAPSAAGQQAVIEEALAVAGLAPAAIGYVEAHGTGTPLGDPIELAALRGAFAGVGGPCALGSLKASLGHLDAAAGAAGLIKAALCVREGRVPASLHFERPNPALELERSPFRVARETHAWSGPRPRRAGTSSFGIGGTNAHAIVEEPPARAPLEPAPAELLVLSARTPAALCAAAERLGARLAEPDAPALAETAWTLQSGRAAFAVRAALVARDAGEARALLARLAEEGAAKARPVERERPLVFLLAGQGELPLERLSRMAAADRGFAVALERALAALEELGLPGREALAPSFERARLADTALAQPLAFALQLAQAERLAALGLRPLAMVGHSLGELVAATLAGVFAREDAFRLVAARGAAMAASPPGAMLTVAVGAAQLEALLPPDAWLAASLGPRACVASGTPGAIGRLAERLRAERVAARPLPVRHAFHTPLLAEAAERFGAAVDAVARHAPRVPWVANADARWIDAERARDPRHWAEALRAPVLLDRCLERLAERGDALAIELGQSGSFAAWRARGELLAFLPEAGEPEHAAFLGPLGRLWERGAAPDWRALDGRAKRRVALPTYPFERRWSWIAEEPGGEDLVPVPRAAAVRAAGPPPGDAREVLAAVWRELLGVERVADDDDFLALGGSSLAAIQLALWVGERLGVELEPARLASAARFGEQLALVERARAGAAPRGALVELCAGPEDAALPPLVLVHGIDGEALAFAPLARALAGERAVWALAAADDPPVDDLEELARRHDAALAARFGGRAVELGGHSFGALVALALARRLDRGGRRAGALVVLDALPPGPEDPPPDEAALRAHAAAAAVVAAGADAALAERLAARLVAHARAAWRAAQGPLPAPLDGEATLVLAAEGAGGARRSLALARWRARVRVVRASEVPGDHLSFLRSPPPALVRLLGQGSRGALA